MRPTIRRLGDRLRARLPDRERVARSFLFRRFGAPLLANQLWRWERGPVAAGMAMGLFVAATPTLGQMVIVAMLALRFKTNLPVALAACWITNPVTMPFIYYGEFLLGAAVAARFGAQPPAGVSPETVVAGGGMIVAMVLLGSALVAPASALVGYGLGAALFRPGAGNQPS
ncbi:MAG: DUF2062 domain-containing protein [Nitrospinae bacterium]|nr:DUF2062 domain-containing protein [Nitrospinota bacterium]